MKFNFWKLSVVAAAALAAAACSNDDAMVGTSADVSAGRDSANERYAGADVDADNTGRNVRDRNDTVTPIDQSNSEADLALTQMIRRGITSNDSMSVQARNVKVISQQGVVTLRGPVKNQAEKEAIETLAKDAGATRIDNQIEIDRDDDVSGEEG